MKKVDLKAKAAKRAEPAPPAPPPAPEPDPFEGEPEYAPAEPRERLFEDLDDEDEPIQMQVVPVRPADGLPALDSDLTEDQKQEFIGLLNAHMPLRRRAELLAKLCTMTDTKRAPVALRAIQEVNAITRLTGTTSTVAPPLFQLPPGTSVSITAAKVKK